MDSRIRNAGLSWPWPSSWQKAPETAERSQPRYAALTTVLVALLITSMVQATEPLQFDKRVVIDVGTDGVCAYGHWLSGELVLMQVDCRVYIDGFQVAPGLMSRGLPDAFDTCDDMLTDVASRTFDYYESRLSNGDLLIFLAGLKIGYSSRMRSTPEVRDAIRAARRAQSPISESTWENGDVLKWFEAEAIRVPMDIEKCKRF